MGPFWLLVQRQEMKVLSGVSQLRMERMCIAGLPSDAGLSLLRVLLYFCQAKQNISPSFSPVLVTSEVGAYFLSVYLLIGPTH